MAKMKVTGWVRGNVFHVDFAGFFRISTVMIACIKDLFDNSLKEVLLHEEVHKARASDFDFLDIVIHDFLLESSGEIAWGFHARKAEVFHRDIGSVIAMKWVTASFDNDIG